MKITRQKIDRIQAAMRAEGVDVLFSRLSVNVLALTGYWSGNHAVAAVFPAQGKPVLLVAETEQEMAEAEADRDMLDIETYAFESLTELRGITDSMTATALPAILNRMGVADGTIGVEQSFEDGCLARLMGDFKYPSEPTWAALRQAFPKAQLKDATALIGALRQVKTPEEVNAIRKAVKIACKGFAAARAAVKPGMTEAELSAILEAEILAQGTGRNGARYARGFSSIYSGPRSAVQNVHWACSTGRAIQSNEIVIMELGAVADGYWCDLTRHTCAGEPPEKANEIMKIVQDAQQAGMAVARPGTPVGEIDKVCHDYLAAQGYGPEFYVHPCGHGTGFNYHEGPPVHAACDLPLAEGMVLCVEPGVYVQGQFGIRAEDMFVITRNGAERLSDYTHAFAG
ncbi:MAG: aminopeptidase P family protein [Kiritimatiellae bacterium]|nr:aminopeptidase P family protein [Kiritimatiellia bacterium]